MDSKTASRLVESVFMVGHSDETLAQHNLHEVDGALVFEDKDFPVDVDVHPLERRFSSKLLFGYPESAAASPSLQSVGMFCFPNGMKFHTDGTPSSLWHSFVLTEENGAKLYGVCLIVHDRLSQPLRDQLKTLSDSWKLDTSKLKLHEAVFFNHVKERMTLELEKQKELDERLQRAETEEDAAVVRRIMNDYGEKIHLYRQILGSYERQVEFPEHIFMPKAFGVLSRWPFIDLFRDYLATLAFRSTTTGLNLPLERYIVNLTEEIPLPPRGKVEVEITLDRHKFYCARPPVNKVPVIKNFSFFPVFRALPIESIVQVVESILAEQKIIFYSKHLAALMQSIETFLMLIFPFYWHHVYIPVMPTPLMGYLQAPVPYIVGVPYSCKDLEAPPPDATVVDLEASMVRLGNVPFPQLPSHDRAKLLQRLQTFATLKLPPGVEVPSVFQAFPGGRLVTTTSVSHMGDSITSTSTPTIASSAAADTAVALNSLSSESAPDIKVSEDDGDNEVKRSGSSDLVIVGTPKAHTVVSSKRQSMNLMGAPKPDSDKVIAKSLQSLQTSLGSRRSMVKSFFSGGRDNSGSNSPSSANAAAQAAEPATSSAEPSAPETPKGKEVSQRRGLTIFLTGDGTSNQQHGQTSPPSQEDAYAFFNEDMIQMSFLNCFSGVLLNYRKHLKQPTEDEWNGTAKLELFRSKEFLQQSDSDRRPFLVSLLETQAFSQFVFERIIRDQNDYEVLFFDEMIKAKKNRSVFTLTKESTPFLDDNENYCIKTTHRAKPPSEESLPGDSLHIYDEFPSGLKAEHLLPPRLPEPLGSTKTDLEMKAHTSALTRKARLEKMQKIEKRFWTNPQFPLKNKAQRNTPKSDEDRSLMFDIILEDVYHKIQLNAIEPEQLAAKHAGDVEAACQVMYAQQRVLISAADDEQLVEKNNVEDLQGGLRTIINYITQYEDHLRTRAAEEPSEVSV